MKYGIQVKDGAGRWEDVLQDDGYTPFTVDTLEEALEECCWRETETAKYRPVDLDKVTIAQVHGVADLYRKYDGQMNPQPCNIELDCEHKVLRASYSGEVGNAIPMKVYNGHRRRYEIPCLTADAANGLMGELLPIAQNIVDGYSSEWDGNNQVATLTEEAQAAEEELEGYLMHYQPNEADLVQAWSAWDYLPQGCPNVSADATDSDLEKMASEIEADALGDGCHVLEGTLEYLESLREALRLKAADD